MAESKARVQVAHFQLPTRPLPQPYVQDTFQLQAPVGQGSFAQVFILHRRTGGENKLVTQVVKVIPKPVISASVSASDYAQFENLVLNEADVLNRLSNTCEPYLLCYSTFLQDGNNWYIVTEFLGDYVSLFRYVKDATTESVGPNNRTEYRNPLGATLSLADQLIVGLMQIHRAHVAHNDIKPANIMVRVSPAGGTEASSAAEESKPRVKFIDFGASCYREHCNNPDLAGFTLGYVAPETFRYIEKHNKYANATSSLAALQRGDIFSLGLTLVNLITGVGVRTDWFLKHPYAAGYWMESFARAAPLHYAAVQKMLSLDPAHRALPTDVEMGALARETKEKGYTL